MDTTAKYIEMCEKAVEIQKQLDHSEEGELLAVDNNVYLQHFNIYWLENYGNGKPCKQWVDGYWESDHPTYYGSKATWLPRQDQLQTIAGTIWGLDYTHPCTFGEGMVAHIWEGCPEIQTYYWSMTTWEQFWLAIVMYKKYNKVWSTTKKEWVGQQEE